MAVFSISLINFFEQLFLIAGLWCSLPTKKKKKKGNCRWLQVTVALRSKCKEKYDEFTLGYVTPPPCFLLSPSTVRITNWGLQELPYPSVALKTFEHNSQLMVNSAFLPGVRRVLLGYSTAHSLGSVIARGKCA